MTGIEGFLRDAQIHQTNLWLAFAAAFEGAAKQLAFKGFGQANGAMRQRAGVLIALVGVFILWNGTSGISPPPNLERR